MLKKRAAASGFGASSGVRDKTSGRSPGESVDSHQIEITIYIQRVQNRLFAVTPSSDASDLPETPEIRHARTASGLAELVKVLIDFGCPPEQIQRAIDELMGSASASIDL